MASELLQIRWRHLSDALCTGDETVRPGRMMSAEALTHRARVFAFLSTRGGRAGLGLRLGRQTDIAALGLCDWQPLAPFRTRPPMRDWIVAGAGDLDRWPELATLALALAKTRKD